MKRTILDLLVDPFKGSSLNLKITRESDSGNVLEGVLTSTDGQSYEIVNGIPRFANIEDELQQQTGESFGYKWHQRESFDSAPVVSKARRWIVEKYGFEDAAALRSYFANRRRILDAGCGAGVSSSTFLDKDWRAACGGSVDDGAEWIGADISNSVDVARERLEEKGRTSFVQADLMRLPFRHESFDTIFSEGVLHHTPSTAQALKSVARLLEQGGEILFYVYRKKNPIREFSDDYIRDVLSKMKPEVAWEALRPLTQLGRALAELKTEINVPEDIPILGIKAGRQDIQRFLYWNVAKMFWNDAFTFEENHHVNFDWYHPKYAHRQTAEQLRQWCDEAGLNIVRLHSEEAGYTVRAIRT